MGVKNDRWIREMAAKGMIAPFEQNQVQVNERGERVVSYGVSSYGYDFRVDYEYKIFKNTLASEIDPKNFDEKSFDSFYGRYVTIPPNSFVLAKSVEYFRIPRDVLALCLGKSTYARTGIILNTTPFEPEWSGFATLEISNTTPLPARVYSGEGIGQVIFISADEVTEMSYADRKGKYDGQLGITLPKV